MLAENFCGETWGLSDLLSFRLQKSRLCCPQQKKSSKRRHKLTRPSLLHSSLVGTLRRNTNDPSQLNYILTNTLLSRMAHFPKHLTRYNYSHIEDDSCKVMYNITRFHLLNGKPFPYISCTVLKKPICYDLLSDSSTCIRTLRSLLKTERPSLNTFTSEFKSKGDKSIQNLFFPVHQTFLVGIDALPIWPTPTNGTTQSTIGTFGTSS